MRTMSQGLQVHPRIVNPYSEVVLSFCILSLDFNDEHINQLELPAMSRLRSKGSDDAGLGTKGQ